MSQDESDEQVASQFDSVPLVAATPHWPVNKPCWPVKTPPPL